MIDFLSRLQTGRTVDGMLLLLEIGNDCYLACREDDPHPRPVYFVHVTWDSDIERLAPLIASVKSSSVDSNS